MPNRRDYNDTRRSTNLNVGSWLPAGERAPGGRQLVVVYGRGPAATAYTTAYSAADARVALERCIAEHGPGVLARVASAASLGREVNGGSVGR